MMTTCIQLDPAAPYSSEASDMMSHDPSQLDFMKMETQGEGNYASTVFSDTRDQKTDHGLTLSPKIQSNGPWLLDAAGTFEDQDLDVLLGPVQFDLIADEAQKNGLELDALFNDQYRLPEPPAKRRRLTGELSEKPLPSLEPTGPACEQEGYPVSPSGPDQAPSPLAPVVSNMQRSHAISGELGSDCGYLHCTQPSDQSNALIGSIDEASLQADLQGGQEMIGDSRDLEADSQLFDFFDDDGSLFGDYVSSKEGSIDGSPVDESLCAKELDLRATVSSAAPAVVQDSDVPIASVERDVSGSRMQKGNKSLEHHAPNISKIQELKLKFEADLFKLQHNYNQEVSQLSQLEFMRSEANGASLSEREDNPTTNSSPPDTSRPLPLPLISALASPRSANSIIEARIRRLLPTTAPIQVPPKLNELLDNLHSKFNNDNQFRSSTLTWLLGRMNLNGGKSQLAMQLEIIQQLTQILTDQSINGVEEQDKADDLEVENIRLRSELKHANSVAGMFRAEYEATNALLKVHKETIPSRVYKSVSAGVDMEFFICELPAVGKPRGICGELNQTLYTRTIKEPKWLIRQQCKKCYRDITKPGARRMISEEEFLKAGGKVEGMKTKKAKVVKDGAAAAIHG